MKLDEYAITNLILFTIYQAFVICDAIVNPHFNTCSIVTWIVTTVLLVLINGVTLYISYKESK